MNPMDDQTVYEIITIILLAIGSIIAYWTVKRVKPRLSIEVSNCMHGIKRDSSAFLLVIDFRVHNTGDKNSTLTALEVSFVDGQGNTQHKTVTLKQDLDAGKSTDEMEVLFSFIPPFPYAEKIQCSFVLHHTFGKQTFVAYSTQSDLTTIGKVRMFIKH